MLPADGCVVFFFNSSSVVTDGQIPSPGGLSRVLGEHTRAHTCSRCRDPPVGSPGALSLCLGSCVLCRTKEIVLALDVKQVTAMNN